jgi:xanthine dehydrogenase accessory factor
MDNVLQKLCHFLGHGEEVVLATVVSSSGSTPRTAGAKMLIRRSGETVGTIGGGLVEYQVVQHAPEVFHTGNAVIRTEELMGASLAVTDQMICGGRMELLMELIAANPANQQRWQAFAQAMAGGRNYVLLSELEVQEGQGEVERWLVEGDRVVSGSFPYAETWLSLVQEKSRKAVGGTVVLIENRRFLAERSTHAGTVYLLGAGHVAQPVAALASLVNFETVVLDDREEFANAERFPQADTIRVLVSFEQAFEGMEIEEESYLVIVTQGHRHDKAALAQCLRTKAGYIGMIGSRRKRDMIYQDLLNEGFSQADIDRVHCPIGLKIGGETPEEIAVSIVAELVQVRSERSTGKAKAAPRCGPS